MSDLRINKTSGDLEIVSFVAPRLFTKNEALEALRQRITIRLRSFQGDWFVDTTFGVPYFQQILGTRGTAAEALAATIIRSVIEDTPGVLSVDTFSVSFSARLLTIDFSATADLGVISDVVNVQV